MTSARNGADYPAELPHDELAEQAVLGSVLKNPRSIEQLRGRLRPDHFYVERNQLTYAAMLSISADGLLPDIFLILERERQAGTVERAGGVDYLAQVNLETPSPSHITHYADIVADAWIRRQLVDRAQAIATVAYRGATPAAHALLQAGQWILELSSQASPTDARFTGLTLEDLARRPQPVWVVDRLLQDDSVAVLEGTDNAYKTFLALAWSHCVALGLDWLGRQCTKGRVLYLLGEGSRGLPRRAAAWQIVNLGVRDAVEDLAFIVDQMPQLWKGEANAVLASNPGEFALIVVDTLARAMVGGNENQQTDMGMLIDGCDALRRATRACVLLLHHLNAQGQTRGSTVLPGGIHTRLRLTREGSSRTTVLSVGKQRDAEPDPPIVLTARTVELDEGDDQGRPTTSLVLDLPYGSAPQKLRLTDSETTALAALSRLGRCTWSEWEMAAGLAATSFRRARKRLLAIGCCEHVEDRYLISEIGRRAEGPQGATQPPLEKMAPGQAPRATRGHPLKRGGPVAPMARPSGTAPDEDA